MISRRIARKPENDNYRRLANYIADANRGGEKCLLTWCSGCWAGDDYELALQEVADTQALNTRTLKEKTYHLIVSFRPEDEARLTPATLKEIESEFAKGLGFEEHQRHCGVHKNTANLHMHVAYNMIHPEKLTRYEPFRDYHTRDRICRELEKRFGLAIDSGRNRGTAQDARTPLGDGAATVEAHTGQQSFEGYARGFRESIQNCLNSAVNWQSLHQVLALHGLKIKPHGNGLVIQDRHGKHTIKASSLDRNLAKGSLEKRLGCFRPADAAVDAVESKDRYQAKPLQRQNLARNELLGEYRTRMAERKKRLSDLRGERTIRLKVIEQTWKRQCQEITGMALTKQDRSSLFKQLRQYEAKARHKLGQEIEASREHLRAAFPYSSWSTFLCWQARQGNEAALAVLRSGKESVVSERGDVPYSGCPGRKDSAQPIGEDRERTILGESLLQPQEKRTLLAVVRMRYLANHETSNDGNPITLQGVTYTIDAKGTIIFTLASGGLIRDMGDQIVFSAHDQGARHVGLRLAQIKWGKGFVLVGNRAQPLRRGMVYDRSPGIER